MENFDRENIDELLEIRQIRQYFPPSKICAVRYAFAVTSLINSLCHHQPDVPQVWFADDATAAEQLKTTFSLVVATYFFGPILMPPKHTLLSHNSIT